MSNFFLILITIVCWGVGSLFYKIANDSIHPMMVSACVTALYVIMIPIGLVVFKVPISLNYNGIVYGVLGGLCMCLGSLAYFFALQKGTAGAVTASTAIYPALTLVLSAFILKEDITWYKVIGCFFALVSVFLLSIK
jgi:transporter family protein